MRRVSSRTSYRSVFPLPILTAFLILAILAPVGAQENAARPAAPTTLMQALKDSSAAIQRQDFEAARKAALQATEIDPQNQAAWFDLAWSNTHLGDLAQAEQAYQTLIGINPRHSWAYNNLGFIYSRTGRIEEAIANYRKQIEVAPRNDYAFFNLAIVSASRGEWAEARDLAAKSVELAPNNVPRLEFLGKAQLKTSRKEDARQSFDRALALPHDAMIENNVAYALADAGVDVDRSWQLVKKALDATAPSLCEPEGLAGGDACTAPLRKVSFMLDTAGWALYRQGKTKEAEPYLRSAFAITPHSESELHIAVVLAKTGRLEEAVRLYAQARTRSDFNRVDARETMRELEEAAGGGTALEALLGRTAVAAVFAPAAAKALALVDANGKVLDVQPMERGFEGMVEAAKALTLPVLAWPGHAMRSIRTIEFQRVGEQWVVSDSYAGETPPPPPCGSVPVPRVLVTQLNGPAAPSIGCPGAF